MGARPMDVSQQGRPRRMHSAIPRAGTGPDAGPRRPTLRCAEPGGIESSAGGALNQQISSGAPFLSTERVRERERELHWTWTHNTYSIGFGSLASRLGEDVRNAGSLLDLLLPVLSPSALLGPAIGLVLASLSTLRFHPCPSH